MKTKNSKVMLALFVVAALAMVSVAGAAMASEKADAKILTPVEHLTIDKDSTDWYGVYTSTTTIATVKTDAKYTGQVHFGSYDTHSKIFDSKVILEFTDVNNLEMTYEAYYPGFVVITGDTAGGIKVLKGMVQLGDDEKYFNGKVSGNTATVDIANAYGFVLKADTVDEIGGGIQQGLKQAVDKDGKPAFWDATHPKYVPAVVKLEGNAVLGGDLRIAGVKFVIAEGATLTGDGNPTAYFIDDNMPLEFNVGTTALGAVADGAIYDEDGNNLTGHPVVDEGVATFSHTSPMPVNSKYNLQMVGFEASTPYVYFGTLTFKATLATTGDLTIKANLSGSAQISKLKAGDLTVVNAQNLTFDPAKYRCLIANSAGTNVGNYWGAEGKIVFGADITDLLVVLQDKVTGKFYGYNGSYDTTDSTLSPTDFTKTYTVKSSAAPRAAGVIQWANDITVVADDVADVTEDQVTSISLTGIAADDPYPAAPAIMNVDGKLVLKYTAALSYADIVLAGDQTCLINVSGVIEYQHDSDTVPLAYEETPNKRGVNAAHYMTGTASPYTHYYTTLDKAMPESSDIKIFGTLKVLKDTTLNGKAAEGNKIAVQADSMLEIGQVKTAKLENITVIATVPKTTTFETEFGKAAVLNGQLKIEDEAEDRGDSIIADVFYISAPYGIYTDLVTALENAKSGDTVTVRPTNGDISIGRNAEVKEGVTLDANAMGDDKYLIVESGTVFTLSGKMTVKGVLVRGSVAGDEPLDAGKLLLKSVEMESNGIALYGVLEFAPSFDNTTDANKEKFNVVSIGIGGSDDAPSVIKIEGKLAYDLNNVASGSNGNVRIVVPGTAKFNVATSIACYTLLEVTGTVTFLKNGQSAVNVTFDEIIATGKAKITPASSTSTIGKVFVAVKAVFGAPANTLTQSINEVDATVYLDGVSSNLAQATVFGQAAKVFVKVAGGTPESTEFIIKVDQQSKVLYQTIYAEGSGVLMKPLPTIEVIGHKQMSSWYEDFECTEFVSSANCGQYNKLYTGAEKLKYTITLEAQNGIKWRVDNVFKEGIVVLEYGEHKVNIETVKGYDISKVTLSKDGSAYTANSKFMLANNAVFSATAPAVVEEKSTFGLIEILLIIITIVIVIMVIIIAMKFMRS